MKVLITLAVALLMASVLIGLSVEPPITCAPGNTHRPDDTTRCGCATDMECEYGIRHDPGDDDE